MTATPNNPTYSDAAVVTNASPASNERQNRSNCSVAAPDK